MKNCLIIKSNHCEVGSGYGVFGGLSDPWEKGIVSLLMRITYTWCEVYKIVFGLITQFNDDIPCETVSVWKAIKNKTIAPVRDTSKGIIANVLGALNFNSAIKAIHTGKHFQGHSGLIPFDKELLCLTVWPKLPEETTQKRQGIGEWADRWKLSRNVA